MSAETSGIPLVVRYNSRGQPDGLKEELNIIVNSVSANEYKGGNIGGPGVTYFSALSDTPDTYDGPVGGSPSGIIILTPGQPKPIGYSPYGQPDLVNVVGLYNTVTAVGDGNILIRSGETVGSVPQTDFLKPVTESIQRISDVDNSLTATPDQIVYIKPGTPNTLARYNINPANIVQTTSERELKNTYFKLDGKDLNSVTAVSGNLLYFNGTNWIGREHTLLGGGGAGVTNFIDLADVYPVNYDGVANSLVIVRPDSGTPTNGDGLIFSNYTTTDLRNFDEVYQNIQSQTTAGQALFRSGTSSVSGAAFTFFNLTDTPTGPPEASRLLMSKSDGTNNVAFSDYTNQTISSLITSASDLSAYIQANETLWSTDTNTTAHSELTGREAADAHSQYVLSATNSNLSSVVATINGITLGLAANTVYVGTLGETQFSLENLTDTNTAEATTNYVLIYREGKWVSVLFDGLTPNKVNEGAPPPGEDPDIDPSAVFIRLHVSGLTASGFSQGDVFKVGPSGTVISSPTYVAPLEGEDGKLQVVNPSNTAIINASGLIWDYLSEGLLVIGDVSAQNYYGNLSFATGEISNLSGVSSIQFETNMPPEYVAVEGEVYYDTDAHTLSIQTGTDTTLQVGQEQVIRVRNDSGEDIQNGSVVYVSGTQGTGVAKLLIGKASATVAEEEQDIIGIATETILDGNDGFITTFGIVRGINTLGTTVGDIIYLSPSAGLFTSAAPEYPNHSIRLGVVLRVHESEGAVFAKIDPGYDIENLHDVSINGIQTGESLYWDGNRFIASALTHGDLSGLTDDDHTQYITTSPLTSSRNVIQPASTSVGLTLQQPVIHTQPLLALKNSIGIYSLTIDGDGNIETTGRLTAESKSFLIDHPTKEGKKLQYTCLEGPENGVYCRGRVKTDIIELPDYWVGLVDEDTITVNLTPVGKAQTSLFVSEIKQNKIYLSSTESIDCFYTVYGERKDIEKLIVEF